MVQKYPKASGVRCRPGDVAQVLRSTHNQSVGLYCQVRQSADPAEFGPEWIVEFPRAVSALSRKGMELQCRWCAMPDAWLLPLRPSDELDEILRIVGLPKDAFTPLKA
jgi:hypothetical protein